MRYTELKYKKTVNLLNCVYRFNEDIRFDNGFRYFVENIINSLDDTKDIVLYSCEYPGSTKPRLYQLPVTAGELLNTCNIEQHYCIGLVHHGDYFDYWKITLSTFTGFVELTARNEETFKELEKRFGLLD